MICTGHKDDRIKKDGVGRAVIRTGEKKNETEETIVNTWTYMRG